MLPRGAICSQSFFFFFSRGRGQSGAHDCRGVYALGVARGQADAPQFVMGARLARRRGHSVHEGRAHFLVGEFCQVASEG